MTLDSSETPAAQELSLGQRAGIYVRTAVDGTGEGLGVARQESACRKYAHEQGWQVTAVYVDNDVSGYRPRSRPGFDKMLAGLDDIDHLVVHDVDRLTRNPLDLETILDGLEQHEVKLHAAHGGLVGDVGVTARIIASVAKYEAFRARAAISARRRRAQS